MRGIQLKTSGNISLSEPIYDYLRDMILNLEIRPGEKIPEMKIAEHFNVSRTPIREALRRLAGEGLVVLYPNRHAEVVNFTGEQINDIGVLRLAMEETAVRFAIFYGSNADFLVLRNIADRCYEAAQSGNRSERIKLDSAFHMQIAIISRNALLQKYQSQILSQVELIQATRYKDMKDASRKTFAHFAILDAMVDRKESEALRLSNEHLLDFYDINKTYPFLADIKF